MKLIEVGTEAEDPAEPAPSRTRDVIGNILFWGGAVAMGLHRASVIVKEPVAVRKEKRS